MFEAKDDGGLDQSRGGDWKKWSDSEYIKGRDNRICRRIFADTGCGNKRGVKEIPRVFGLNIYKDTVPI